MNTSDRYIIMILEMESARLKGWPNTKFCILQRRKYNLYTYLYGLECSLSYSIYSRYLNRLQASPRSRCTSSKLAKVPFLGSPYFASASEEITSFLSPRPLRAFSLVQTYL